MNERHALLHLIAIGGTTAPRRALLRELGSACAVLEAGVAAWRAAGLDARQCRDLSAPFSPPDETLHWFDGGAQRHLVGFADADYPPLLREIAEPPLALFVAGNPIYLWHPALAIVGSRMPSAGGLDNARAFAAACVRSGLAVTSGLAAGIDGAAHRAALDAGGLTVAVLGTGIDVPYPARHAELHRDIEHHGVLVSEYPPGTPPRRGNFPARNRIIAGLALGTLVVEAALRSGALITARLAAESGREVFAIPGSIHNPMARGCHHLIRQGAALVEDAGEIIESLAPLAAELGRHLRKRLHAGSAETAMPAATPAQEPEHAEARRIWQALGHDPVTLEHLAQRTGLTAATLSSALLMLELDGWITSAHGRYTRRAK